jgi:stage II sporulation protein D
MATPPRAWLGRVMGVAVLILGLSFGACQQQSETPVALHAPVRSTPVVLDDSDGPLVRVRLAHATRRIQVAAPSLLVIRDGGGRANRRTLAAPLTIYRTSGAFRLEPGRGAALRWRTPTLWIETSAADRHIRIKNHDYPGQIRLLADDDAPDRFDMINHLHMERFLPGVLDRELFSHWHPTMFLAQAIAARSYAMHKIQIGRRGDFDLEATTASQVYGGWTQNARALEAVDTTRGLVLTYGQEVLPAYYSSCCGGTSQDASLAFPDGDDAAPLRGRQRGGWCAGSHYHRWGPLVRPTSTLVRRIALWGRAHGHRVAALRSLSQIRVERRNSVGRPSQLEIRDRRGRTFDIRSESFRHACNYKHASLPSVAASRRLPSAHVNIAVNATRVCFTNGRGHGHGVGLCQYGAEALACSGYNAASILNFYYAGATVRSMY